MSWPHTRISNAPIRHLLRCRLQPSVISFLQVEHPGKASSGSLSKRPRENLATRHVVNSPHFASAGFVVEKALVIKRSASRMVLPRTGLNRAISIAILQQVGAVSRIQKVALRTFFFFFSLIVALSIYTEVIRQSGDFGWDEAAHALRGLIIARDLKQGDWLGFLYDSYRQVYWPPVHSWLTGIAFLIGGTSTTAARTVSLVAFVMAAWAIYLAALQMEKQDGDVAATVAATLFMTSPSLIAFAGQSMLEIPGLLFLILTFLVYFKLNSGVHQPRDYALLGLAVSATYFVKSNYGALLVIAIFTVSLIEAGLRPSQLLTRANLYAVLPLLVLFPIWFAYAPKLTETWRTLINQPFGVTEPYGPEGLLFYPLGFLRVSGSAWILGLLLISLLVALKFRQDKNVKFLITLVLIQVLIGQIHHTKVDRHIFPTLPALFLLTGHVLARWWRWSEQVNKGVKRWLPRLCTALIVASSINLFVAALRPSSTSYDTETIRSIVAAVPADGTTLLIGSSDIRNPSPPPLDWELVADENLLAASQTGTTADWEAVQNIISAMHSGNFPDWVKDAILPLVNRAEGRMRSLYLGLPPHAAYSRSRDGFRTYLRALARSYPFDCAVVITSMAAGARYPMSYLEPGLQEVGLYSASTEKLQRRNIRIDVYRRPATLDGTEWKSS